MNKRKPGRPRVDAADKKARKTAWMREYMRRWRAKRRELKLKEPFADGLGNPQ